MKRFVIDTSGFLSYHSDIFSIKNLLTNATTEMIRCIYAKEQDFKLIIPSIAFFEIYEKWLVDDHISQKFYYEVYGPTKTAENIEIRPLDQEVLSSVTGLKGALTNHELHDKIVLATAVALSCPLITTDQKITEYVRETSCIPAILR